MEIKEVCVGGFHKILSLSIDSGKTMEEHYSTSDAFIIVLKGKGELIFENKKVALDMDTTYLIPALKTHQLKVTEDLKAYLVLGPKGGINRKNSFSNPPTKNSYVIA